MSVRYYGLPDEDYIELADGTRLPVSRNRYAVPLVIVPPLGCDRRCLRSAAAT